MPVWSGLSSYARYGATTRSELLRMSGVRRYNGNLEYGLGADLSFDCRSHPNSARFLSDNVTTPMHLVRQRESPALLGVFNLPAGATAEAETYTRTTITVATATIIGLAISAAVATTIVRGAYP